MRAFSRKKLFKGGIWATFTFIVWEVVESVFDYLIAYFVSSALSFFLLKTLAAFAIIKATEIASVPVQKGLLAFFQKIFYRKGEKKLNTLKNTFKKIWQFVVSNKCSLGSIFTAVIVALCGSAVINVDSLPEINIAIGEPTQAIIQETDIIAEEIVYSKEAVIAEEIIYGEPIYATEKIYAESTIATEKIYDVKTGELLYDVGDVIQGELLYDVGDVVGMEILYNVGDIIEPAEILYNVGDVVVPAGTVLQEAKPAETFNITPIIFWALMGVFIVVCGVFFENPQEFAQRIAEKLNLKQEKENIKIAKKELAEEQKSLEEQEQQKIVDAEKSEREKARRLAIDKIKEDIKAGKV